MTRQDKDLDNKEVITCIYKYLENLELENLHSYNLELNIDKDINLYSLYIDLIFSYITLNIFIELKQVFIEFIDTKNGIEDRIIYNEDKQDIKQVLVFIKDFLTIKNY